MQHALKLAIGAALVASVANADVVKPSQVAYVEGTVEASLTGAPGDPVEGKVVFTNRKLGNCLACHTNASIPEESFHGEVGPAMDGVADRWSEAELRGIVSNSKKMFEGTIMPGFYVDAGLNRTLEDFDGKSILTAQQVEDVVAYLMTLKEE